MGDKRRVLKQVGDQWLPTGMPFLRKGDIFKLFEVEGLPVKIGGIRVFECSSDAYWSKDDDAWKVDIKDIDESEEVKDPDPEIA